MMLLERGAFLIFVSSLAGVWCQGDTLGLDNGYITINTTNFNAQIVGDAQVLASLIPAGDTFDFLPFDLLSSRASNNQYHWGDITFRYREDGAIAWIDGDSAAARQPVAALDTDGALAASDLSATLPTGPINVTREWLDVSGDIGLRFTLTNTGATALELGSLGFPAEFNSIFTNRAAGDIQRLCSLSDPYIGMHAGYIRANPVRGTGAALVVTPLAGTDTPLEAYRNLDEPSREPTYYASQTFEGLYEWQVLSRAWAENEWNGATPWNDPSSHTLAPGEEVQFGLRFSVVPDGVRGIDAKLRDVGTPVAFGVPGYIIARGEPAQLFLQSDADVSSISSDPASALAVVQVAPGAYSVTPVAPSTWGRARLTVAYADNRTQTVHYHVTKPAAEALGDLGAFLTNEQWFADAADPFGRAPAPLTYDYEAHALVTQDARVWIAGLSDEGGAGAYLAAVAKQVLRPSAAEVAKLAAFVDGVLWGTVQNPGDHSVRKSAFYYDPGSGFAYSADIDWGDWWSWDRDAAYAVDRAYDYVHVAAAHWALYRVARAHPGLLADGAAQRHGWDWYLARAHGTVVRGMRDDVGYSRVGLMGETVFGEILKDLRREGLAAEADEVEQAMRSRAAQWDGEEVPYGSEMAWDSTGQEGVYYWAKHFGFTDTVTKTVNSVLGYMPTVPHWGWNGNARRYWDNIYGGKLQRIERQIHHYGSALNAQVLLSAFRADPTDTYLLAAGYGGASGPLSNINADGFAAASFHSFPDTLKWDGYSGDYGPGFLGLALGSGTYVAHHADFGLLAYGGVLEQVDDGSVAVRVTGPVGRRMFIGPLGVEVSVDAGTIERFSYVADSGAVSVTLAQLEGGPETQAAVLWVEGNTDDVSYKVASPEVSEARGGWQIPLSSGSMVVELVRA